MNDNPPEFPQAWYEVVVPENTTVGETILLLKATSKDTGLNAQISYEIVDGNEQGKLALDQHSGK